VNPHDVILRPVLSEKVLAEMGAGKYAFYVHPSANKTQIKEAIERVFEVDVLKLNLLNVRGKEKTMGRFRGVRPRRKKVIVTLKPGQRIQQLEGLT
jgi:large subunit ribosomal protein L23